jgi:hypothetical protein
VAVQDLPVGSVRGGGAVRVQDEPPAAAVDPDVVVEVAQQHAVADGGCAAVGLVGQVVHVAPGGGPPAAGQAQPRSRSWTTRRMLAGMESDPAEPGAEPVRRPQPLHVGHRGDRGLLHSIARQLRRAEHPFGEQHRSAPVPAQQLGHRLFQPGPRRVHQLGVWRHLEPRLSHTS